MSALAMFCYQDPSLLQFMHRVKAEKMAANLTHIWAIDSVPSDSQMRVVMDEIDPKEFESLFTVFFRLLQRGKHVEQYRVLGNYYLCAIDGSGYFSSDHIGCPSCLRRKVKKKQGDTLQFSHQIVQAALVHPKLSQVIPLAPEQVKNTDGSEKQDCETNAAKRLLGKIKKAHPKLPLIIVGDGLYSKQPMIESTTSSGMHYVFTAKPDDHKILVEWVNGLRLLKRGHAHGVRRRERQDPRLRVGMRRSLERHERRPSRQLLRVLAQRGTKGRVPQQLGHRPAHRRRVCRGDGPHRESTVDDRESGLQYGEEPRLPYRTQLRAWGEESLLQLLPPQHARLLPPSESSSSPTGPTSGFGRTWGARRTSGITFTSWAIRSSFPTGTSSFSGLPPSTGTPDHGHTRDSSISPLSVHGRSTPLKAIPGHIPLADPPFHKGGQRPCDRVNRARQG